MSHNPLRPDLYISEELIRDIRLVKIVHRAKCLAHCLGSDGIDLNSKEESGIIFDMLMGQDDRATVLSTLCGDASKT